MYYVSFRLIFLVFKRETLTECSDKPLKKSSPPLFFTNFVKKEKKCRGKLMVPAYWK